MWRLQARRFASASGAPARILRSDVQDIIFHFAVEEYLLQVAKLTGPVMYLWRPSKVVTIGRHQNPWKECVLSRLDEDGVKLVRRRTGGGAVFQDAGCSVFTFISPSGLFSIDRNFEVVLGALGRLGVQSEKKGRNDLTMLDGRKISGSAFKHVPDCGVSLHHGTVLVDTDMTALQRYLTPDKRKLQAKGISSVGARVCNLRPLFPSLDHHALCEALIAEFRERVGTSEAVEEIDEASALAQAPEFRAFRAELEDKEWRLGHTPDFSHKLETRIDGLGIFDVQMEVVNGKVSEAAIFSDALYPDVIDEVKRALPGAAYGREGLRAALEPLKPRFAEEGPQRLLQALSDWLVANVDD